MSVFSSIKSFFGKAAHAVSDAFVKLFGKDVAEQFAAASGAILKTVLGQVARDSVAFAETLALDGAGKRAAALKKIGDDAKSLGYEASESIYSLLIEVAVAALKGKFKVA